MRRENLARLGGIAAVVGGLAWVVKGAVILATGDQPPLLFELAPLFLAGGLFGLYLRVAPDGRSHHVGRVMAGVALAGAVFAIVMPVEDGAFSAGLLINSLALLVGLIVLGLHARRQAVFGDGWRSSWPLWLGIGTFPALAVGGTLAAIDERLLEVPLVIIGGAWAALGVLIARHPARRAVPTADSPTA